MIPPAGHPGLSAWSDESFQEKDSAGFYIIAAAIIEPPVRDAAREAMLAQRGRRATAKAHWTEMDHREKKRAARAVAELDGVHVVAVGSPVPFRKQERARSKCLTQLVTQLHAFGVECLFMEAREPQLNQRDIRTVQSARFGLPKGTAFRIEHVYGGAEPLLWVADVVAGACRAHQLGRGEYWAELVDVVVDFEVDTDC
ncbi:hypothetical protein I5Q34_26875 [Streptomyces sp. AV19]|uniref:hypothetical protein n=1 Tax=Streptomyces sp. AV19 TaxID=2793068 RepID=UPI0018FEB40F|nr:hypothetical protein [Streptomyces sp. AV19]MBH1937851.1 hypothetical protein [Streptomyces sp. AV19]MDG4537129.1 hypothetical protein [Streptomyces sp. AV19]